MKKHELKCWRGYYEEVVTGRKKFEVRKNDRDYHPDDELWLREWDNELGEYTGRDSVWTVGYILYGPAFGVEEGYCVMSIERRNAC